MLAMITTLLGVITTLLFLLWRFSNMSNERLLPNLVVDDPSVCASIIACTDYGIFNHRNSLTPVQSRAYANQRLVRAFGIDNAFTTTDNAYRLEFRNLASRKITLNDEEWTSITGLAKQLVGKRMAQSSNGFLGLRLDSLVQMVALKISLYIFFDITPLELNDELVLQIAEAINLLWIASKSKNCTLNNHRERLDRALGAIIPDSGSSARRNPLNVILPAYETMWRVSLLCLVEVIFRHGAKVEWRDVLIGFLENPSKKQFADRGSEPEAVSAADIINEALRLYPPTKRIYRRFHIAGKGYSQDVVANIEACHRSRAIWGSDSWLFKPSRWINLHGEALKAFMPFGGSSFICPAKPDFGPKMIGVVVAALAAHIDSAEWKLELCLGGPDGGEALTEEEPLASDRGAYEWIEISKRHS